MEPRFIYHANALAIGGFFTRPVQQMIDLPASSSLPSGGGYSSSKLGPQKFGTFLSFEAAQTQVSGTKDPKDGSYTSLASATLEGVNVLDVMTVDRIVGQLATKYVPGEEEPIIVPLGTRFEKLRIGGRLCEVDLDLDLYTKLSTYASLRRHYESDATFRKDAADRYGWNQESSEMPESKGLACCSLLKAISGFDENSIHRQGYQVHVPQFGTITIGEFHVSKNRRRLTMLRLDLGSPVEGSFSLAEVEGNGSMFP